MDVAWNLSALSRYANTADSRGTSANHSAARAKVANVPQCRQTFVLQHRIVALIARNRRFTVDLSGTRPRRWKSEFLSTSGCPRQASVARMRGRRSTGCGCWSPPTHTRPQTREPPGGVEFGRWPGASVECRVMSGATAASADQTGCAEQRDGAGGGDAECDDAEVRDGHRAGWRRDAGGLVIQAIAAD